MMGLGILLKCRFLFSGSGWGLRFYIYNLFPVSAAKLLAHGAQVVGKSVGWSPKGQRWLAASNTSV